MATTKRITGPFGLVGISGVGAALGKSNTWGTTWAVRDGFPKPAVEIELLDVRTGKAGKVLAYWDVATLRAWYAKIGGSADPKVKNPRGFAGTAVREKAPSSITQVDMPEPMKRPRKPKAEGKQAERQKLPKLAVGPKAEVAQRPLPEPKGGRKPRPSRAELRARKAEKEAQAAATAA